MEDKMIVLKQFTHLMDAEMLVSLLRSEGIDCYVRDTYPPSIFKGISFGGIKVELLEKDLQRALEIMRDFGYLDCEGNKDKESEVTKNLDHKKEKLSKTMILFCALIVLLVVIIIYLNKYYNG